MAKTINLGKVGLTFGGDYDSSKDYASRTCVFYNHVSWASKKDVPAGIAPGTNDAYWQKVSERGAQGIQGERGPQGNSAFDGTGIELVNNLTEGGEASALSAEQGKILKAELTELESDYVAKNAIHELFGKNIFNKETLIANKFIVPATGEIINSSYAVGLSANIPVLLSSGFVNWHSDSADISTWNTLGYVFYDCKGNVIKTGYMTEMITKIPQRASILRVSIMIEDSETFMVEYGEAASTYEPYDGVAKLQSVKKVGKDSVTKFAISTYGGKNLFNKNTLEDNNFLSPNDGKIYTSSFAVSLSAHIPILKNVSKISWHTTSDDISAWDVLGYAFYDVEGSVISYGSMVNGIAVIPYNAETIRVSIMSNSVDSFMVEYGETASTYEPYDGLIKASEIEQSLAKFSARTIVNIYLTDSEIEIVDKLFAAYNSGNCDVYFETGEYNFTMEGTYDYIYENYKQDPVELPIGGNNRYFFNGSTLIGSYSFESPYFGRYNIYLMGSQRNGGSYELHDGILIANDLNYCVHDEAQRTDILSIRRYDNIHMIFNAENRSVTYGRCIGGGSGKKSIIEITNCIFENNNAVIQEDDISYHGWDNPASDGVLSLTIANCYFKKGISLDAIGDNEIGRLQLNNSSYVNLETYDEDWRITQFMNEIRNS